ncbi:uncharacterized protein TNCV_932831 [Trichonephila clavipes]|nr:uncharacterized protein TNCV_932831 [Trichonephila clavipes]
MKVEHTFLLKDVNGTYPFDIEAECTEIHQLNTSMQCLFAMTAEDCVEIIEYLDYNYYIFCNLTLDRIALGTTTLNLGTNPGEDMDVCKYIVPLQLGNTLNSLRAASPLVRLVEREERKSKNAVQARKKLTDGMEKVC